MLDEAIAKLDERSARAFRSIRRGKSMMKMNLDLSPPFLAMLRETGDEADVILLRRGEVRVTKRSTFAVAVAVGHLRVLAAPALQSSLLFVARREYISAIQRSR